MTVYRSSEEKKFTVVPLGKTHRTGSSSDGGGSIMQGININAFTWPSLPGRTTVLSSVVTFIPEEMYKCILDKLKALYVKDFPYLQRMSEPHEVEILKPGGDAAFLLQIVCFE